jgi:hypothetical protein
MAEFRNLRVVLIINMLPGAEYFNAIETGISNAFQSRRCQTLAGEKMSGK